MRKFIAGAAVAAALTGSVAALDSAPAGAAPVPSCQGALIALSHNQPQGAAGHANVILRYKNISQSTCSLRGYPGLDALGPHGGVLAHATRTLHGFTGGTSAVRTIVLHSFQTASADLEWANFGADGHDCRFSASIATTPPNTSKTFHRPVSVSVCSLQVHPVVRGLTGNAP
ncbi:MAG TPA: DUF4232 domain-containing protein [Jatrophihabitans sp.]|jgi:hypothetical protein